MKNFILFSLFVISIHLNAQINAVTENGDEVILFEDATWTYKSLTNEEGEVFRIETNEKAFKKSNESTFQVKSNVFDVAVWLNPKKWSFKKGVLNEDAEYEFQMKNEDLYALLIT